MESTISKAKCSSYILAAANISSWFRWSTVYALATIILSKVSSGSKPYLSAIALILSGRLNIIFLVKIIFFLIKLF